mmetsp:Transcript_46072/g.90800  ORF Transcript_46072/g.90800 Transcript_46072/m.90800 type:complete len:415 (-) Transcript_46072:395-1639(-)
MRGSFFFAFWLAAAGPTCCALNATEPGKGLFGSLFDTKKLTDVFKFDVFGKDPDVMKTGDDLTKGFSFDFKGFGDIFASKKTKEGKQKRKPKKEEEEEEECVEGIPDVLEIQAVNIRTSEQEEAFGSSFTADPNCEGANVELTFRFGEGFVNGTIIPEESTVPPPPVRLIATVREPGQEEPIDLSPPPTTPSDSICSFDAEQSTPSANVFICEGSAEEQADQGTACLFNVPTGTEITVAATDVDVLRCNLTVNQATVPIPVLLEVTLESQTSNPTECPPGSGRAGQPTLVSAVLAGLPSGTGRVDLQVRSSDFFIEVSSNPTNMGSYIFPITPGCELAGSTSRGDPGEQGIDCDNGLPGTAEQSTVDFCVYNGNPGNIGANPEVFMDVRVDNENFDQIFFGRSEPTPIFKPSDF